MIAKADKKLTKVIKAESKMEKNHLASALKELSNRQAHLKACLKHETKMQMAYSKGSHSVAKSEKTYHAAKTRWEKEKAEVSALEGEIESAKRKSGEAKARLEEMRKEVEKLREERIIDEVNAGAPLRSYEEL